MHQAEALIPGDLVRGNGVIAHGDEIAPRLVHRRGVDERTAERRDQNLVADICLAKTETGTIERVSRDDGADEHWWDASVGASLDATGRIIVFSSLQASAGEDVAYDFDGLVRFRR